MKQFTYKEILQNLNNGICNYGNERSGIVYCIGNALLKIHGDGKMQFFKSKEQMARNINKFLKIGN